MKDNNFKMITDKSVWDNKFSMEDIDYSLLLTKVFGKPIETATAFMYLFRRYGYTNRGSDDYKELCSYAFHTNHNEVIVRWGLAYPSSYQYHLCAFVDKDKFFQYQQEKRQPFKEWQNRMKEWTYKNHKVLLFSMFDVYKSNKEETLMEFVGTAEQEADVLKIMADNGINNSDNDSFMSIEHIKNSQYQDFFKKYEEIEPLPKNDSTPNIDFSKKHSSPLDEAEKQHQWILQFDERHFVRQTYFAAMALFEDWKRPTYVRDVYFNLAGEASNNEEDTEFVEYSNNAGYGIPTSLFEGDNLSIIQDVLK